MGPGLTSDRNFQNSVEVYRKGDNFRRVVYGQTRDQVVAQLERAYMGYRDWQDDFVVTATKTVAMGLGPAWARATRKVDEYGERV